jgi:DNA-binding transcriptional LysR family regulator
LLDDTAVLTKEVQQIGTSERAPLTIGVVQSLLHSVFPRAFMQWRKEVGKVPLRVFGFRSTQIVSNVLRGEYDFGIVARPSEIPKLTIRNLFQDPFVAVLPAGHRLARSRSIALQTMSVEPQISWPRGYPIRDLIDRASDVTPFRTYTAEVESLGTILELVRARLGTTLLPLSAVSPTPRGMVVRKLDGDPITRRICSIERKGATLTAHSQRLIDLITSAALHSR